MNSTTSFIQRIAAGLSARARAASAVVVTPAIPTFAGVNQVFGGGNPFGDGMTAGLFNTGHMNFGWLGDVAATGCVKSTSVTKRITGRLCEGLT